MAEGLINALKVGGGLVAIGPLPGAGDVARLAHWGARLVFSMTGTDEMASLGASGLPAELKARGIDWMHLPIVDFGAPGQDTAALWPLASATACRSLGQGGRVFIHCRGGCGRSGMAALRLMIEMGEAPDAALARLRAVRPCAVETEDQLAWARAGQVAD